MYYLTVEELTALLPSVFTPGELLGVGWSDYTPEEIEAILGRSEVFLDNLKFKGRFKERFQQHAFPRVLNTGYVVDKNDERVLKALCSIFYDYMRNQKIGTKKTDRIRQGIKSISTGGVSETYGSLSEIKEVSDDYVKFLGFCLFNGVL